MDSELKKYGRVYNDIKFKDKTSIRIGGTIQYYIEVFNEDSLIRLIRYLKSISYPYFILGNGTNILASDEYFKIVVISLKKLNQIMVIDDYFIIGAGALNMSISSIIMEKGFFPPYCISLVPGSIGGSIYMNASSNNQEIKDYLFKVEYLDGDGNLQMLNTVKDFNYRYSPFQDIKGIILRGYFRFIKQSSSITKKDLIEKIKQKQSTQPLNEYNMGSVFKNLPEKTAWQLITENGLSSFRIGDAMVSSKHANFLVNHQNATFDDMVKLIAMIKDTIYQKEQLNLELEIKVISPQDINPY